MNVIKLFNILTIVALAAIPTDAIQEISCNYYTWSDERGNFEYCATWDQPLTGNHKNEVHKFSGSAEKKQTTTIKFIRAGKVEYIPDEIMTAFPKLDGFILETSDLPVLKHWLFNRRFSRMKSLEIYQNNLKEIEKDAFVHLPNLEWIRLSSNQIEKINVNIFKNNKKLKYIDLRNNLISSLTPNLLSGLNNLEQVLLADRNFCSQKNFKKSDGTLTTIGADLKTCFDNCRSSETCDTKSPGISIDHRTCGRSTDGNVNIQHGQQFRRGKFPWMAAFYFKDEYVCGGTLISNKHILTAAHCIIDKGENSEKEHKDSYFLLGKNDLSVVEDGQLKVAVSKFTLHPDWDNARYSKYFADIAIAHFKNPVTFTSYIQPICMNQAYDSLEEYIRTSSSGPEGTATGWGKLENPNGQLYQAKEFRIPFVKTSQCQASDFTFFYIFSEESSFCGGNIEGNAPCKGDSGGGVYVKRGDQWTIVGITSFLYHKCESKRYEFYTEVGKYNKWVLENAQ